MIWVKIMTFFGRRDADRSEAYADAVTEMAERQRNEAHDAINALLRKIVSSRDNANSRDSGERHVPPGNL